MKDPLILCITGELEIVNLEVNIARSRVISLQQAESKYQDVLLNEIDRA